jgi:hypothetical protein
MMEHKPLEPNELIIELSDAELDAISGGRYRGGGGGGIRAVGISQNNIGGNILTSSGGGSGGTNVFSNTSRNTFTNLNSGSVTNSGGLG